MHQIFSSTCAGYLLLFSSDLLGVGNCAGMGKWDSNADNMPYACVRVMPLMYQSVGNSPKTIVILERLLPTENCSNRVRIQTVKQPQQHDHSDH